MATAQFIGQLLLLCGAHGPIDRLVHACLSSPLDDPFDSFSEELAKPAALSTSCTEQLFISHGLQFKRLISHFSSSFNDWVGVSGGLPLRLLWSIPREWLRSIPETAPSGSVLRTHATSTRSRRGDPAGTKTQERVVGLSDRLVIVSITEIRHCLPHRPPWPERASCRAG